MALVASHESRPAKDDAPDDGPAEPILPPLTMRERLSLGVEVLRTYAQVRWLLRRNDLKTTTAALRDRAPDGQWTEPGLESLCQAVRLATAVKRSLTFVPADTRCLMQSLVLTGLLSRRGIGSVLVISVNPGTEFEAHAWVEHDDRPLLPTLRYARLLEL
jgi:Transglutaminase-like superfamily